MRHITVALILIGVVVLFSIQNAFVVSVSFLFWRAQASLAVVVFFSALSGFLIGIAVTLFLRRTGSEKKRSLQEPPGKQASRSNE